MASTIRLLAVSLTLFSSALAFSSDQCNATSYGRPDRTACNTLLTDIQKLGTGNTSYLFIPAKFPTPAGLSNGTRRNFPQIWNTTGCNAALVPVEVSDSSVTYDTSTYRDLAAAGAVVVQQCIANQTRGSGGWELAGDMEDLVLHLYATGSEIDKTVKQQTSSQIAATSEEEIEDAEVDDDGTGDAVYDDYVDDGTGDSTSTGGDTDSGIDSGTGSGSGSGAGAGTGTVTGTGGQVTANPQAPNIAPVTNAKPQIVQSSGTFGYFGCQLDNANSRTLSSLSWQGEGLTVQRCAAYCAAYQYMGVEFGSQCYCGGDANAKGVKPATIVTTGASNCTTPCNGDATQVCGGTGWLSTYQNRNSATAGQTA